ncbi:GNAT family N-acetyltransferase [Thalassoroseus pseudoceratinae]|uniref:GNAT family N-acetyltransferase n=1 Tax=Thalassoroseus pseudoceratinae TaxID=2713176 RepID=UPI00142212D3|nr:GNAT family N-acetyltransferase [Thalassoroseus pseudoceratinae]
MTKTPLKPHSPIDVEPVPKDRYPQALELFFHDNLPTVRKNLVEHWLAADASGDVPLDGLLWASVHGRPVGAAFFSRHRGSMAFVWQPIVDQSRLLIPSDPSVGEIKISLLHAIGDRLSGEEIHIGQMLTPPNETERELYRTGGFPWVTDLHYLLHTLETTTENQPPDWERISYEPGNTGQTQLFASVLERTWEQTQDCPELNGLRTGLQALDGHREGVQDDELAWSLFTHRERPIGLCLVNPREGNLSEIVYVGVVPEARGNGYGRAMVSDALRTAREQQHRGVVLAVDSRNEVARRIYRDLGFSEVDRLSVYLRLLH